MNFGQMKTKVADYLNRSDLSSIVPDLINMAIHRIEKKFNFRYMQKALSTYSFVSSTYYYAVPSDYKEAQYFKYLDNTDLEDLKQFPEEDALLLYPDYTNDTGDPKTFSYIPNTGMFLIRPTPDAAFTAYLRYWGFSTDLSGDSDTHWLLTNAWEAVLYGALMEAEPYLKNDQRIATWGTFHKDAVKDLKDYEFRSDNALSDSFSAPTYSD